MGCSNSIVTAGRIVHRGVRLIRRRSRRGRRAHRPREREHIVVLPFGSDRGRCAGIGSGGCRIRTGHRGDVRRRSRREGGGERRRILAHLFMDRWFLVGRHRLDRHLRRLFRRVPRTWVLSRGDRPRRDPRLPLLVDHGPRGFIQFRHAGRGPVYGEGLHGLDAQLRESQLRQRGHPRRGRSRVRRRGRGIHRIHAGPCALLLRPLLGRGDMALRLSEGSGIRDGHGRHRGRVLLPAGDQRACLQDPADRPRGGRFRSGGPRHPHHQGPHPHGDVLFDRTLHHDLRFRRHLLRQQHRACLVHRHRSQRYLEDFHRRFGLLQRAHRLRRLRPDGRTQRCAICDGQEHRGHRRFRHRVPDLEDRLRPGEVLWLRQRALRRGGRPDAVVLRRPGDELHARWDRRLQVLRRDLRGGLQAGDRADGQLCQSDRHRRILRDIPHEHRFPEAHLRRRRVGDAVVRVRILQGPDIHDKRGHPHRRRVRQGREDPHVRSGREAPRLLRAARRSAAVLHVARRRDRRDAVPRDGRRGVRLFRSDSR